MDVTWERENLSFKKLERTVKHDVEQVEKVIKEAANDAIHILKEAGEDVAFAPLLLFKKPFEKELDKYGGYHGDGTILDITGKFIKAKMGDYKKSNFDKYNADTPGKDSFGLPIAPAYISAPVAIGCDAVGVPSNVPGLPSPANVVWGFIHHESKKAGSPVAAAIKTQTDKMKNDKTKGLAGFLHDKKKMAMIVGAIAAMLIIWGMVKGMKSDAGKIILVLGIVGAVTAIILVSMKDTMEEGSNTNMNAAFQPPAAAMPNAKQEATQDVIADGQQVAAGLLAKLFPGNNTSNVSQVPGSVT